MLGKILTVAVVMLLAPASSALSGPAWFSASGRAHVAAEGETVALSKIRSDAFLPQIKVNQDPTLNSLLQDYIQAAEALPSEGPGAYDGPVDLPYCGCFLYERQGEGWKFISPSEFAASRGQSGQFGAWVLEAPSLDELPKDAGLELFLDARVSDIATQRHAFSGEEVLVVLAKLAPGPARINTQFNPVDAYKAAPLVFTSLADTKKFQIDLLSGGRWLTKFSGQNPDGFDYYSGFAGLRLNFFANRDEEWEMLRLGWGARYRIRAGGQVGEFTTRKVAPPRKSWIFAKSASGKYKRMFLAAVRRLHPTYRAIVSQVAPYTTIKTHKQGGYSTANGYSSEDGDKQKPFTISFARDHLNNRAFRREVIAHELAHIIDYAGFDHLAYKAFLARFKKSKAWRRCIPGKQQFSEVSMWPCAQDEELIADQIAYAAAGGRSGEGGYGDPRLLPARTMLKMVKQNFYFTNPFEGYLLTDEEWNDMEPISEDAAASSRPIRDHFPVSGS